MRLDRGHIGGTIRCFLLLLERHPVRPCSCSLLKFRLAIFHGSNTRSNPVGDANKIIIDYAVIDPAPRKRVV